MVSALHEASSEGNLQAVKDELSKSPCPPIDIRDNNGCPPLFLAAAEGHGEVVGHLLSAGASVNVAVPPQGWTSLWIASYRNHLDVLHTLCNETGVEVDCTDANGRSPLWAASSRGLLSGVQMLFKYGADPSRINNDHCTPLLVASQNGSLEVASYLLSLGSDGDSDINTPNIDCLTPLWVAAHEGHIPLLHLLHQHGADIAHKNTAGQSAFWIACLRSQFRALTSLHTLGADPDAPDSLGRSPLWMAAKTGNFDVVRALHVLGCDLDACDKEMKVSPMWIAAEGNFQHICSFLLHQGANMDSLLRTQSPIVGIQTARRLVQQSNSRLVGGEAWSSLMKLMWAQLSLTPPGVVPMADGSKLFASEAELWRVVKDVVSSVQARSISATRYSFRREALAWAHKMFWRVFPLSEPPLQRNSALHERTLTSFIEFVCLFLSVDMVRDVISLRMVCRCCLKFRQFPVPHQPNIIVELDLLEKYLGFGISKQISSGILTAALRKMSTF